MFFYLLQEALTRLYKQKNKHFRFISDKLLMLVSKIIKITLFVSDETGQKSV